MNLTETKHVLAQLLLAYPGTTTERGTADAWHELIGGADVRDAEAAVLTWVRVERRFPAIADMLTVIEEERVERLRQERLALPPAPAPEPQPEEGELFAHERKAQLEAMIAGLTGTPEHNHREGAAKCAVCGPRIRREPHVHSGATPEECPQCRDIVKLDERLYHCAGGCLDTGMVEEANGLRPCATCNRDSYDLWVNGCYSLDHRGCDLCRPSRRRRSGVREEQSGRQAVRP